jgi:hypothetical protein
LAQASANRLIAPSNNNLKEKDEKKEKEKKTQNTNVSFNPPALTVMDCYEKDMFWWPCNHAATIAAVVSGRQ